MNVKQKVRGFLGTFVDESSVADDDNIFEKGLVNSLFAVQLVSFIEREFDLTINNNELDLDNFKDINSIAALVESKME